MLANPNRRMAENLVSGLETAGVREVVLSPGSRSTPLVLAFAHRPRVRRFVATDERSAAFFALGLAREARRPVVVLCTSGTAAANLFPAVAEASLSCVPLILLTADRPPEERDVRSAQTIDQVGIFGAHVRFAVDLPAPAASVDLDGYWRRVAARAVAASVEEPRGPVHLNAPFREPLYAPEEEETLPAPVPAEPVRVHRALRVPCDETIDGLVRRLAAVDRGLLVCGPGTGSALGASITRLAERLAWPVLVDPLSGLRFARERPAALVDAYDLLLREEAFAADHRPQALLRFGAPPVSKALERLLRASPADIHVVVAPAPTWPDPGHGMTDLVRADAGRFADALGERLPVRSESPWARAWVDLSRRARGALDDRIDAEEELFEGKLFRVLRAVLPDAAALHVGNSMPVRDLDAFLGADAAPLEVACNRGANGIDGVVSSAVGGAVAGVRATALVIGDLAFLHDLGGLQIAARHGVSLLVVVVDNDGGGIFSFLPQRGLGDLFESDFATPHGLDLEPAARLAGAVFTRARSWGELGDASRRALVEGGLHVVVLPSDRERNRRLHVRIFEEVRAEVFGPRGAGVAA